MNLELLPKLPVENLVYIGIGELSDKDIEALQSLKAVWLIDADSDKCCDLENLFADDENIAILNKVISAEGGQQAWHKFNLAELNGLQSLEALKTYYPGLRQLEQSQTETQMLSECLKPLKLNSEQNNLLLIDIPFQSQELLNSLQANCDLTAFDFVYVNVLASENGEQQGALEKRLTPVGFDFDFASKFLSSDNADYQAILYKKDSWFLPLQTKRTALQKEIVEKKNIQKEYHETQQKLSDLQSLKSKLEDDQEQARSENQQLLKQLQNQLESLKRDNQIVLQEREDLQKQFTQLESQVNQKQQALEALKRESQKQSSCIDEITKVKSELEKQIHALTGQYNQVLEEIKNQKAQNSELLESKQALEQQLDEFRQKFIFQEQEVEQSKTLLTKQTEQVKNQKIAQADLEKQIQTLLSERNHEQKRKDDEKAKNVQLEADKKEMSGQLEILNKQLSEKEHSSKNFEQERNKAREERDSARTERDRHKENLEKLQKQFLAKENLLSQKLTALSEAKKVNAQLLAENKNLHNKNQQLQTFMNTAEAQLEIIKAFVKS